MRVECTLSAEAAKGNNSDTSGAVPPPQPVESSFGEVVRFVEQYSKLIVLTDAASGAAIAVWPALQGRVLTSTAAGPEGLGFGWINRELIASGEVREHINAAGGEDRFWIGPEGGQFSIFFAPEAPFDLDHWYTPAAIDTEPFDVVGRSETSVAFSRTFALTNYSVTQFDVRIDREVRLLTHEQVGRNLGIEPVSGVKLVGYESENKLTNVSAENWSEGRGLLSIWILGQFQSTEKTAIVLPIHAGSEASLGIPVTADYFGTIPEGRLFVGENAVFLKADARYRGKLGLSLKRAKGVLGSFDGCNGVLTIVQYTQPTDCARYVNSAWKMQDDPYSGDVANCYNDGPPAPGKAQLGEFYELESSSPARELKAGESVEHSHRTLHFVGTSQQLDAISRKVLGVGLEELRSFTA
jgi:hypothetical protein